MSDDLTLTSNAEPGQTDALTSSLEPEAVADGGASSAPQPTLEQIIAERDRYRAAHKGSSDEWRKEKERREALERQLQQFQYQQQQQQFQQTQKPKRKSAQELSDDYQDAVLSGDKTKAAQVFQELQTATIEQARESTMAEMAQLAQQGQQQSSFASYMRERGIKPSSPIAMKVGSLLQEMQSDPNYAYTGGNQMWLTSIAIERARAELGSDKEAAYQQARMDSAQQAATESSARGPAKSPAKDTIFLTDAEKKVARKMYDGPDAEKRYWQNMNPGLRDARIQAGKAII